MARMRPSNFKQHSDTREGDDMNSQEKTVTTIDELVAATKDNAAHHIVLRGSLKSQ